MTRRGDKPAQIAWCMLLGQEMHIYGNQLAKEVTESNLSALCLILCVTEEIELIRHKLVVVGFNQSCELKTRSH